MLPLLCFYLQFLLAAREPRVLRVSAGREYMRLVIEETIVVQLSVLSDKNHEKQNVVDCNNIREQQLCHVAMCRPASAEFLKPALISSFTLLLSI
jgi:hypothetical protein